MPSGTRTRPSPLWHAFAKMCGALTLHGRYHDAGGLLDRGVAMTLGGRGARERDPTAAAVERWDEVFHAAPDAPIGHYRLAANLRKSGDFERAQTIIDEALRRFPNDLGTTIEAARLAERAGDNVKAYELWNQAMRLAKPRAMWLGAAAHALMLLGRFDEAEFLVAEARAKHPRHRGVMAVECMLASSREDWPKAVRLWTEFNRRFPKYPGGWEFLGRAVHSAELSKVEASRHDRAPVAPQDVGRVEDDVLRELLLGFESIGETCEFGLVQRRFGAEPLSLLRWNLTWAAHLTEALQENLEGLGEPENTELEVLDNGEFFVTDKRWYLGMHTYLFAGQTTHDVLYPKLCQRIVILKTWFLANLAAGRKTFVHATPRIDKEGLLALHEALRRFGPVRLLLVLPASPEEPSAFSGRPGEVSVVGPGLLVGFVRRLGITADMTWDIAFDDWIAICRKAAATSSS